jgi:hypothetical protein
MARSCEISLINTLPHTLSHSLCKHSITHTQRSSPTTSEQQWPVQSSPLHVLCCRPTHKRCALFIAVARAHQLPILPSTLLTMEPSTTKLRCQKARDSGRPQTARAQRTNCGLAPHCRAAARGWGVRRGGQRACPRFPSRFPTPQTAAQRTMQLTPQPTDVATLT